MKPGLKDQKAVGENLIKDIHQRFVWELEIYTDQLFCKFTKNVKEMKDVVLAQVSS